jgi:cholesterol transport system auxiliary component
MRVKMIEKNLFRSDPTIRNFYWIPVVMIFTLSACMTSSSPPKPTYYYTLDYPSPALHLNQQLPAVLRIERFAVSPPFHTQRIIYAGKNNQRNSYAYHQWIAAPGELLPYFLARDLRKTNGFKAVLTPSTSLSATHSLHGWVEEFIEKDGSKNCAAEATIHISLINNSNADPASKIMLQKRYHASVLCHSKTPAALAESMSKAVAEISSKITRDIHSRLSSAGALKY